MFRQLFDDERIAENPVARVRPPKKPKVDKPPATLTDREFAAFLNYESDDGRAKPGVRQRQLAAILARTLGGARTGDLHKLTWRHLDAPHFEICTLPRLRNGMSQRFKIPALVRPFLQALWGEWREWPEEVRSLDGPVFPLLRDSKRGEAGVISTTTRNTKVLRRPRHDLNVRPSV